MTVTSYNLPVGPAGTQAGGSVPGAYVPGTGSVPLRGGTPNTTNEGSGLGSVTTTQQLIENGGVTYVAVTAASAAVLKATAGRLVRLIVIATGTAAVSVYDNTASASGTIIFTIPANAATGTIYQVEVPLVNGAYLAGTTNTPAVLATIY